MQNDENSDEEVDLVRKGLRHRSRILDSGISLGAKSDSPSGPGQVKPGGTGAPPVDSPSDSSASDAAS